MMAEASNGDKLSPIVKDSPNGAAGPMSSADGSVTITDEMSIHLSPRDSFKDEPFSPRAAKYSGKPSAARPKYSAGHHALASTPKPRPQSRSTDRQKKPATMKRNGDMQKQKCDMCEEMRQMSKRCLNCQLSMCDPCLKHHRKMKICVDHELQEWDKYVLETAPPPPPPVPDTKQMCKVHKGERLQFYCKICFQPLCIACKLTKHEGHKTRDLIEEITEQRDIIPMKISQVKASFLPLMKQQLKELEDYDDQLAYNVKGTLENIEKRAKIVKDEVDRTSKKLIERLKNKEEKENERISNRKKTLNSYVKIAQTAIASAERVIKSGDDFEVMELYQSLLNLLKKMQEITKTRPGKSRYVFQDGQLDQGQLQLMFGNYSDRGPKMIIPSAMSKKSKGTKSSTGPVLEITPEIQPRLITSFNCKSVPGNKISAIAPVNDQEAWLCFGWTTNEIYLYNKDGYRKNRIVFKHPVDDLALDHEGNLLVSVFTGSIVRIVDRKLQARDFFQCPLRCRGLTVSNSGHVVVCGVDMCTAMPPPLKCTIFKFTAKGNKTGHLDGDKTKRVPIHPYRVTENIDGSLAVSDWVNDKEGRVVVFSHDGKVRMVYYGYSNETRNFLPYGIASDKFGHIIVGDIINHEVHLLDIKGHFLRVLLTREDLDGERPYSLAVDSMGMLWVGNERAQIKIFRYLLNHSHIVSPEYSPMSSEWVNDRPSRSPRRSPRSPSVTPRMPLYIVPVDVVTRWQMDMKKKMRMKVRYKHPPQWQWSDF